MGVNGIYGLSGSGLDIESMVKVGMLSKQSQYDKMQQQYIKNEWIKEAYVDMYGKVQTFNNSTLSQYKMSANMNARSAESSDSSVKVTANANAAAMTHHVEVTNAATNAYLIGENSITRKGDSQTSTQLKDALFSDVHRSGAGNKVYYKDSNGNDQEAKATDVAFRFSVGDGVNGGVTVSDPKVATAAAGSSAASGKHTVNITAMESSVSLTSKAVSSVTHYNGASSSSTELKDLMFQSISDDGTTTTVYNPASMTGSNSKSVIADSDLSTTNALQFTLSDGENSATVSLTYEDILTNGATLETLADKVNDAGLNITAKYDTSSGKFSLTNDNEDVGNRIISITTLTNEADNKIGTNTVRFLDALGLKDSVTGKTQSFTSGSTTAVSSTVGTVDGNNVTFDVNNKATVNGVVYNAHNVGKSTVNIDKAAMAKATISVTYGQLADGYTFNDLTAAVNSLGTNVRAAYDSVNDKFSFYNMESGSSNTVAISIAGENEGGAAAAEFFNAIGLKQSSNGQLSSEALKFEAGNVGVVTGTNASVKVDGMSYDISDNKLTVNGVTYNFTGATAGTTSNVTVTHDTDAIIDKVKSFVEDYNNLLKTLTDAYNEKPNKNYKPLTDSQKDKMKDEQIEKWEEKARAGLLYHDKTLGKLISEMREAVSSPIEGIEGKYNTIFALGISTTGVKGQLTLDEDKLKAALTDDPDSVYNVFAKLDAKDMDNAAKSGIAQRLGDVFTSNMKSIRARSGTDLTTSDDSELSKLLRELQTKMSNFKSMMNAFEDKLYKKYDAMETALARLGTQLNYVSSAFN